MNSTTLKQNRRKLHLLVTFDFFDFFNEIWIIVSFVFDLIVICAVLISVFTVWTVSFKVKN